MIISLSWKVYQYGKLIGQYSSRRRAQLNNEHLDGISIIYQETI